MDRSPNEICDWLRNRVAELLSVESIQVDDRAPLDEFGLDSIELVGVSGELEEWLECRIDPEIVYECRDLRELAAIVHEATGSSGAVEQAD